MTTQVCTRCFKPKDIDEYKSKWKTCEVCRTYNRNYLKKYYGDKRPIQKKPALKEYFAEYYKNNKEELKEKALTNWKNKRELLIKNNYTDDEVQIGSPLLT